MQTFQVQCVCVCDHAGVWIREIASPRPGWVAVRYSSMHVDTLAGYECVSVYICVCTHIHGHTHRYTYLLCIIYTYIYIFIHTCIRLFVYLFMYVFTDAAGFIEGIPRFILTARSVFSRFGLELGHVPTFRLLLYKRARGRNKTLILMAVTSRNKSPDLTVSINLEVLFVCVGVVRTLRTLLLLGVCVGAPDFASSHLRAFSSWKQMHKAGLSATLGVQTAQPHMSPKRTLLPKQTQRPLRGWTWHVRAMVKTADTL